MKRILAGLIAGLLLGLTFVAVAQPPQPVIAPAGSSGAPGVQFVSSPTSGLSHSSLGVAVSHNRERVAIFGSTGLRIEKAVTILGASTLAGVVATTLTATGAAVISNASLTLSTTLPAASTGKKVLCIDTATGIVYVSDTALDCS